MRRAFAKLELLGKVRRGYFVEGVAGQQFARPETIDALRETKLRHARMQDQRMEDDGGSEPMILLNTCEPANVFTTLFPIVNAEGEKVRYPRNRYRYVVFRAGRPVALYYYGIRLLVDLSRDQAEALIRTVMTLIDDPPPVGAYKEVTIGYWNGHPIEVHPARHLLTALGFVEVEAGRKRWVYGGSRQPTDQAGTGAESEIPARFARAEEDQDPVVYDARLILSLADERIRPKFAEVLDLLRRILPSEYELVYRPGNWNVKYRGHDCLNPGVGKTRMRLGFNAQGFGAWQHGIPIQRDETVDTPEFAAELLEWFERTRQGIDRAIEQEETEKRRERSGNGH